MYKVKANLHNHSRYSDGTHSPRAIIRYARKHEIRVLSITDHNDIRGTLKGARFASFYNDLIFFPGIELMFTVDGHIYELLAYFFDTKDLCDFYQEYRFRDDFIPTFKQAKDLVLLIEKHNGVVVVPHPFGRKGIFRKLRNRGLNVHAIEVINAFTGEKRNKKARNHKDNDNDFLKLGTADMHFFLKDMTKVYTELTSKAEITKEAIWQNLGGKEKTINFKAKGKSFKPHKIFFQKPLCTVVYSINHPFIYARYKIQKSKLEYKKHKEQRLALVDEKPKA